MQDTNERSERATLRAQSSIEIQIERVGSRLVQSVTDLLAAVPGRPTRPIELSKALGVNKDLSSKVLSAARKRDPIAATADMPGPEALRLLVRAAASKGIDQEIVSDTEDAVLEFADLLQNVVGGRSELEAAISAWLPEVRERFELANKRAMFKAVSNLKGVRAEVSLTCALVFPSACDAMKCDVAVILGLVGLRRLRPGASIHRCVATAGPGEGSDAHFTLDGEPVDALRANTYLAGFCSTPAPRLKVRKLGRMVRYFVEDGGVGLDSEVDLFFGEVVTGFMERYKDPEDPRKKGVSGIAEIPSRTLILDVLVHDDIWRGSDPEVFVYDTVIHGVADPNDRTRDDDKLPIRESIQVLGRGISGLRISEVPRYSELLRHACDKVSCDPQAFRCFRCRVEYPFYGSQVLMGFDPPVAPVD